VIDRNILIRVYWMAGCARFMPLLFPVITAAAGRKPGNKSDHFYAMNIYQFFDKNLVKS